MTDDSWYVVRNTPGVTGFMVLQVEAQNQHHYFHEEVEFILKQMGVKERRARN